MRSISVNDLCERSGEILDDLNEKQVPFVVMAGDKPVALLSPLAAKSITVQRARAGDEGWEKYVRLAESLRASWPEDRDTRALLNDIRRRSP